MAVVGELNEAQLGTLAARVRDRIVGTSTGMSAPDMVASMEIAGAAVAYIVEAAPKAPESIGREAATLLGGWLLDRRPAVNEHTIRDPAGTEITVKYNGTATGNAYRNSGASALVSRFVVRRGGAIG